MTIKNFSFVLLTALSFIWVGCSNDDTLGDTYVDTLMEVSETTVWEPVWGSDISVEHMLVKEPSDTEWRHLVIGEIEDFEYMRGHAYELRVRKTILANPPQDGSNCRYRLLEIISDTQVDMDTPNTPEELPDEAKFQFKMVQLKPFMDLDTPLAAPFDFLTFRILDHQGEYSFPDTPKYLAYYDSIVMTSPNMPDTYRVYSKSATIGSFTSQWGSYFYEKSDFPLLLKGYKEGEVIYETSYTQVMRERDFLGIDWQKGSIALANPQSTTIYCLLATQYEFLLTDTQELNGTPYVKMSVVGLSSLTDAENIQRQVDGLRWLLKKHLGYTSGETAASFKTLPKDASFVEAYGNETTRVALLHFKADDFHEESYSIIAEPK